MTKVRAKRLAIVPEVLFHIFQTNTAWRVVKGIPEGATFRGFTQDPYTQLLYVFIEHDSFEEIDLESTIPPNVEALFKAI